MRGLLSVAIALAGLASAQPVPGQAPLVAMAAASNAQDRLNFEAGLLDSPGGAVFRTIKRLFPADYEALVNDSFKAAAPHLGDKAALLRTAGAPIAKFWKRRMPDILNAPASALVTLNQSQLNLLRALRKGHETACAQYVDAGFDGTTALPLPLQQQAVSVSIAMLKAAKAGSERPRDRSRGKLDGEIAAAWMDKMKEVEPSPAIQKMLDDDAAQAAATPAQTCQMGIALYAAIAKLPPEQAAKMTAYFLKTGSEH